MNNEENAERLKVLLKSAIAPMQDAQPRRDLWPQILRKLDHQPEATRIPWFDWALAAVLSAALLFFPGTIPALLYHL